ncbi:MAG: hypothetical protein H6553_02270 [Chitinophagales bacterium]|nr:hypothetical protein [Chitinophagales bacterium]
MKKIEEIYQIIDSMTASEKAYISKFLLKSNKDSDYLKLFNFLCKNKKVSEAQIKSQFPDSKLTKYLSASLGYLHHQILETLAPLEIKKDKKNQIWQELNFIYFLNQRGLYLQSKKQLSTLKKVLENNEQYEALLLLLQIEIDMIPYLKKSLDEKQALIQERINVNQKILYENKAILYVSTSENLVYEFGVSSRSETLSKINILKNKLDDLKNNNELSLKAKYYLYHAYSNVAIVEKKYLQAFDYLQILVDDYDKKTHLKKINLEQYIKLICNYANRLSSADAFNYISKLDKLFQQTQKLEQSNKSKKKLFEDFYATYFHVKYGYYLYDNDFLKAYSELLQSLKYKSTINKNKALYILRYYDYACASFYIGKYDDVLQITNAILNHENRNVFPDVLTFTKILQLLVWYEKKEHEILLNHYESIRNHLKLANFDITFEKEFIRIIYKLHAESNKKLKQKLLQEFKRKMFTLEKNYPSITMFFKTFWWIDKELSALKI